MDNEQVNQESFLRNLLGELIVNFKRSIILMIAILIASLGVGYTYASLREPEYIAEEQIIFSMGDGTYIQSEINAMYAHHPTVLDFCDSGVVIDRANFYYQYYLQRKSDSDYTLDKFITDIQFTEFMISSCEEERELLVLKKEKEDSLVGLDYNRYETLYKATQSEIEYLRQQSVLIEKIRDLSEEIYLLDPVQDKILIEEKAEQRLYYENKLVQVRRGVNAGIGGATSDVTTLTETISFYKENMPWYYVADEYEHKGEVAENGIHAGRIGMVKYDDGTQEYDAFVTGITYQDSTQESAIEKVKILVVAYDIETLNFFSGMNARIRDLGTNACSVDITTTKIMVVSAIIGVALAVAVVYVKMSLDKTVKSKKEAEKITGVSVLSCIAKGDENL